LRRHYNVYGMFNHLFPEKRGEIYDLRDINGKYLSISAFNQIISMDNSNTSSEALDDSLEAIKGGGTKTASEEFANAQDSQPIETGIEHEEPQEKAEDKDTEDHDKDKDIKDPRPGIKARDIENSNKNLENKVNSHHGEKINSRTHESNSGLVENAENAPLQIENHMETNATNKMINYGKKGEVMQMATCTPGLQQNCGECCAIFTNNNLREAFGYTRETAACECHDICVEDVRDICVSTRTISQPIPCTPDGGLGCRGSFAAGGVPEVESIRVLCADESLDTSSCLRIINNVQFAVLLSFPALGLIEARTLVTVADNFDCNYFEFARFPTGTRFSQDAEGQAAFREELAMIDGSCKVITINRVNVRMMNNVCTLTINYTVVDKLWKHENLLVSALKPYADNITVSQKFRQGHAIGACPVNNTNSSV
jgi:hypothetical protein